MVESSAKALASLRILHISDHCDSNTAIEEHLFELMRRSKLHGHVPGLLRNQDPTSSESLWNKEHANTIKKYISSFKPDVVHAHKLGILSPSALMAAKQAGVKVVMSIHDFSYELDGELPRASKNSYRTSGVMRSVMSSTKICLLRQSIDKCCDSLLVPSEALYERTRSWAKHAKVLHVPYPVDCAAPQPDIDEAAPFLYAGDLEPHTGFGTLLDAQRQTGVAVQILVAGEGSLSEEARSIEGITLLGKLGWTELLNSIDNCRGLILPGNTREERRLFLLQVMAKGRPVIASTKAELDDLVVDGVTGCLLPTINAKALAHNLERLSQGGDEVHSLGNRARQKVKDENDPDLLDQRLFDIYR